jgi:anti-sigma-K factor RskA
VSQILTVLSIDADASSFESGEKATDLTQSLWPSSVCWREPVAVSQILTVLSIDANASSFESGEKATELT